MAGTRTHTTRTVTSAVVLGATLLVPPLTGAATRAVASPTSTAPAASAAAAAAPAAAAAKTPPVKPFEKRPIYTRELGLAHPTGATFLDGPRLLAIAQSRPRATAIRLLDPRSEKLVRRVGLNVRLTPGTLADN